jgi:hypothetical protein
MAGQHFAVALTRTDQAANPYFYVPFAVGAGVTRIDVALDYQRAEDCVIDVGLLDPHATDFPSAQGLRGWSGSARERFFVATDDATPGYLPGAIAAGDWRVVLGLHRVPAAGASAAIHVTLDRRSRPIGEVPCFAAAVRRGAGWYQGDLHCHTFHSDARGAPETLHDAARQAGLDFLAVSDHNTISHHRYFGPRSSPELVFIRAMEVTTSAGHANVFGLGEYVDFRLAQSSDARELAERVHDGGGLLSINHDKPPDPWSHDLADIDCMEVWQSHWFASNWIALARYDSRLRGGRRVTLVGGSDFHQPQNLCAEGPLMLARPTTRLWLDELSERAVLAALKSGRGYVTEAPSGPHLSFTANGRPMGASIAAGNRVTVETEIDGAEGDRLVWIDARGPLKEAIIPSRSWRPGFSFDDVEGFLRAEIVADASRPRLVEELEEALAGKPVPWGGVSADIPEQPLRRALSNPVYVV